MAWTNVAKPTDSTYTKVNSMGRETYDDTMVTYDDANTFYDGADMTLWTMISKPALPTTYTGRTMGLLIPLTKRIPAVGTDWTSVNKPTT